MVENSCDSKTYVWTLVWWVRKEESVKSGLVMWWMILNENGAMVWVRV
jgi:hypothetical protein